MATSVITITPENTLESGSFLLGYGSLAIGAGDYATNGLAADFAAAHLTGTSNQPIGVQLFPNNPAGYVLEWDRANKKIKVRIEATVGTNTPLGEHTVAALNANLTGASIRYIAFFTKA